MAIIKYSDYASFENQFDSCMLATANNFVAIGYLLKQARDTDILKESGYSSMGEFARTRYGLDESKTSRFIAICEKFGNGEDRLIPEYESFGYAKLSEMLLLPDNISEVITPEMTREEIREIKQEVKDEQSISPVELALEENEKTDEDILITIMREYLRSRPEEFSDILEAFKDHDGPGITQMIADILAPAGMGILVQRISGKGKFMLKIEGIDNPVTLVDVRNETNTSVTWDHFYFCINEALPWNLRNLKANEAYREIYGEDMPEIKKEPEKKPERIKTEKKAEKKKKNNKIAPAQKSEKEAAKPEEEDIQPAAAPTACQPAKPADVWDNAPRESVCDVAQKDSGGVTDISKIQPKEEPEAAADDKDTLPAAADDKDTLPAAADKNDHSEAAGAEEIRQAYHKAYWLIMDIEKSLVKRNWKEAADGADVLTDTIEWLEEQDTEEVNKALNEEFDDE